MVTTSHEAFGKHVRWLRLTHNLRQEELAKRCGLSPDTIRRLEHGTMSPSFTTLRKLAAGFGCSVSELFRGFEDDDYQANAAELVALVQGRGARVFSRIVELVRLFLRTIDDSERDTH
jgi:transcriptional regulator with XRE-family HTH domain